MQTDGMPERRLMPGESTASGWDDVLTNFCREHHGRLLRSARRRLRRKHVPESEYAAEDLVQSGYRAAVAEIVEHSLSPVSDMVISVLVRRAIKDEVTACRDRMNALKRGGTGIKRMHGGQCDSSVSATAPPSGDAGSVSYDLSLIMSRLVSADVDAAENDTIETLFKLLSRYQAIVAHMRCEGLEVSEIATKLAVSTRTVERYLNQIREVWRKSGLIRLDRRHQARRSGGSDRTSISARRASAD